MEDYEQASNIEFNAVGSLSFSGSKVPVSFTGRYSKTENKKISIEIYPKKRYQSNSIFNWIMQFPAELEGKTRLGERIWIPQVSILSRAVGNFSLSGSSQQIVFGDLNKIRGRTRFKAFVPSTSLLTPNLSVAYYLDGRIAPLPNEKFEADSIEWDSVIGKARFTQEFEFYDGKYGVPSSLIRLQNSVLIIDVSGIKKADVKSYYRSIAKETANILNLLSIFSLKRLGWYQTELLVKSRGAYQTKAHSYGFDWMGFEPENARNSPHVFLPILPIKLKRNSLFSSLYHNYSQSEFKEIIKRAINYLLSTYEYGYRESHYSSAYSALETIVNGTADENTLYILTKPDFKKLKGALTYLIETETSTSEVADDIKKKLQELRRRSFADKVLLIAKTHNIDLSKIWKEPGDIEKQIREVFRRRNALIHNGLITNNSQHQLDFFRIRKLALLLILKLLGCPTEAINGHWINQDG